MINFNFNINDFSDDDYSKTHNCEAHNFDVFFAYLINTLDCVKSYKVLGDFKCRYALAFDIADTDLADRLHSTDKDAQLSFFCKVDEKITSGISDACRMWIKKDERQELISDIKKSSAYRKLRDIVALGLKMISEGDSSATSKLVKMVTKYKNK